jgi:hypothetical protein
MAKIHQETVVLTFSTLIKDSDSDVAQVVNADTLTNLEAVAQELAGANVIVEVIKAE